MENTERESDERSGLVEVKSEDFEWLEGEPEDRAEILRTLQPNEYMAVYTVPASRGTQPLQSYLENLKRAGLDVGKGDAEYGFKMPVPEKDAPFRKLIVFKRRK